jgi:hypothetical protein
MGPDEKKKVRRAFVQNFASSNIFFPSFQTVILTMSVVIPLTMTSSTVSEISFEQQVSIERLAVPCAVMTAESSFVGETNVIEADYQSDHSNTELTPYPYATTSEEIKDYYQLEMSLGEDWSFRLARELSSCEMSIDGDCAGSLDDDSFTPFFAVDEETSLLPEDIEIYSFTD